jgi:uncharacterized protein YndB with AHSA1/START domain
MTVTTATADEAIQALHVCQEIEIAAPIEVAFEAVLAELGPEAQLPDGTTFSMKIEPWPGGRWYRDLGNNAGHFWGHVQVIKPPTLLEICGPLFMSYPATSHVQYRLTREAAGTRLKITHRAFGQITGEHREGVHQGWRHGLQRIREIAERRSAGQKGGTR